MTASSPSHNCQERTPSLTQWGDAGMGRYWTWGRRGGGWWHHRSRQSQDWRRVIHPPAWGSDAAGTAAEALAAPPCCWGWPEEQRKEAMIDKLCVVLSCAVWCCVKLYLFLSIHFLSSLPLVIPPKHIILHLISFLFPLIFLLSYFIAFIYPLHPSASLTSHTYTYLKVI